MDGSKNAMYMQAGKSRGWIQGAEKDYVAGKTHTKPVTPVMPAPVKAPMPISAPIPAPVYAKEPAPMPAHANEFAMPPIPAPPMLVLPNLEKKVDECQTLVMARVTNQKWQDTYEPEQGFTRGTLFQELDLPFVGEGACRHE